jgi:4-hydroxythreonine-4-phosphate dehydrogenase
MQVTEPQEAHPHRTRPIVGITLGDTNGIGPEVVLKSLQDPRLLALCVPVIYGSLKLLKRYKRALGESEETNFQLIQHINQANPKRINLLTAWEEDYDVTPGHPNQASGMAAYKGLERALADAKAGDLKILVTAPIAKQNMPASFGSMGHTDYLAKELAGGKSLMVMAAPKLRVALATDHIPLREVAPAITRQLLEEKITQFYQCLRTDFGSVQPKIAVLGLNPHAGESGKLGKEEMDIIATTIQSLRDKYPLLVGPLPADGFFGRHDYSKFDGVLALYHDQGLIPFKALAGGEGVNFTAGLPIVRTSPAHGTAFDIAGKGIADPESMLSAIWCGLDVERRRQQQPIPHPKPDRIPKPLS